MFLSSYTNTSERLGEREMPWKHEPQAGVFTAFSSSPKLSRVFVDSIKTEYMFSISFRKRRNEKKENNLLTLNIKR